MSDKPSAAEWADNDTERALVMNDTPRTDAFAREMADEGLDMEEREKQLKDFAKTLEVGLASMTAERDRWMIQAKLRPAPYADADLLIGERDAARKECAELREFIRLATGYMHKEWIDDIKRRMKKP
jgi:hypothetical protein